MQACCTTDYRAPMRRRCISRWARPSSSASVYPRPSRITRRATRCGAWMRPSTSSVRAPQCGASAHSSMRSSLPRTPAAATRAPRPSSSSACRAPAPRWWSRSSPATRGGRHDGAAEHHHLRAPARRHGGRAATATRETSGTLHAGAAAALGARYLEETAPLRTGREHFTDKLPNNFSHVGLIQAILPNATIIDARRHPMDACFSTFKQHFAAGQTFSYDLEDLGRYYRCYLSLMDHWDAVLPGQGAARPVRGPGARAGGPDPPPARALRPRLRARLPELPRDPPLGAHRQRRAGAPADLHLRGRLLAALRARARAAARAPSGMRSHALTESRASFVWADPC